MTITVLPTPAKSRRQAAGYIDSAGRYLTMECVYSNTLHDFDITHGTAPERYNPATTSWTTLAEESQPIQAWEALLIDSADRIYRAGGQLLNGFSNPSQSSIRVFDSIANSWSTLSVSFPSIRLFDAGWVDASGVWVGGGEDGATGYADLYLISGGTITTKASPSAPYIGPQCLTDAAGKKYFVGINSNTTGTSVMRIYDPTANSWTTSTTVSTPGGITTNQGWLAIDVANGLIYYAASVPITGGRNLAMYRYTIASNTWFPLATMSIPTTRTLAGPLIYHVPLGKLFVLGLLAPGAVSDMTIYQYDPALNTWSATADVLSAARIWVYPPAFDGTGYYIGQGSSPTTNDAVNVVEYFNPGGGTPPPTARGSNFVAIVG